MNLYHEHLAKYLADERFRQLASEAQTARFAKALRKEKKASRIRALFGQLNIFARSHVGVDGR